MRKMTVKDFIDYSCPCFGCGKPNNFRIGISSHKSDTSYLRGIVGPNFVEIDLLITYSNVLKLYIFHKTNEILANDKSALMAYLSDRKVSLETICPNCHTQTVSHDLKFHLDKGFIEGTTLSSELTAVTDGGKLYHLYSYYDKNISNLLVVPEPNTKSGGNQLRMTLPLMSRERFKNRQRFLEKIKTYIVFS
jgi:hypothetical protein